MATTPRTERRSGSLSKERIVEAATAILDSDGEAALTFRALAERLSTGSGALYWHVANKHELLSAVTDAIVTDAITTVAPGPDPSAAIRQIALGVFDAIDLHPWMGTHLASEPWQAAALRILEHVGRQLESLGLPERAQFDTASAFLNYLVGLAAQHAAAARLVSKDVSREAFLATIASRLNALGPAEHLFAGQMAEQLQGHDDREQFLAGVDLYLAGVHARAR